MIQVFADWLVYGLFGLSADTPIGVAVNFFSYDTIKILILLFFIILLMRYSTDTFVLRSGSVETGSFVPLLIFTASDLKWLIYSLYFASQGCCILTVIMVYC